MNKLIPLAESILGGIVRICAGLFAISLLVAYASTEMTGPQSILSVGLIFIFTVGVSYPTRLVFEKFWGKQTKLQSFSEDMAQITLKFGVALFVQQLLMVPFTSAVIPFVDNLLMTTITLAIVSVIGYGTRRIFNIWSL